MTVGWESDECMKVAKEKRGQISISIVVAMLIAVVVFTGLFDIMRRTYTMNEVHAIMDVASVTALRSSVDEEKLRLEQFEVDKSMALRNYEKLVKESIQNYGQLESFHFVRTKIEDFNENWGLGVTSSSRPQVLIDSSVVITVRSSFLFDNVPSLAKKFYDSRNNGDFVVTYQGKNEDGEIELAVRSVSRVVYR